MVCEGPEASILLRRPSLMVVRSPPLFPHPPPATARCQERGWRWDREGIKAGRFLPCPGLLFSVGKQP